MNIIPDVRSVMIEVTRRCNMKCEHCLRGGTQNVNITLGHIDTLISQVGYISSLVFTGGEPSLNVPAITYTLERLKQRGVCIGSFFIATNGKKITEDFVVACLKLYAYSDEKESCQVSLSNDQFHEKVRESDLLQGLSFYDKRYKEGKNRYVINEGRAYVNGLGERKPLNRSYDDREGFVESEIYLNVFGEIINGCDWSFANQKKHKVCSVLRLADYYESLPTEEE